jgi:hypothetical protein
MFAAILLAISIAYPFDAETLARRDVRECFEQVLKGGGYGHLPFEAAAFLVVHDDAFECRLWPRSVDFHAKSWSGRMPEDTAAIIHSHPADLREPSLHDALVARKLGIPVFVVTPRGVTRADP